MNDWNKLKEPFSQKDIEWRVSRAGAANNGKPWAFVLAYVTNRAIMDRLDEVFGIAGWKNEFKQAPEGGILCGISFKHEGEWITKWDGAENTSIDAVKGGLSSSMKRCGVQLGIGRYLYNLTENFAVITQDKKIGTFQNGKNKGYDSFYWLPPDLPDWALPETERKNKPNKEDAYQHPNYNADPTVITGYNQVKVDEIKRLCQLKIASKDWDKFCDFMRSESVDHVQPSEYDRIISALNKREDLK